MKKNSKNVSMYLMIFILIALALFIGNILSPPSIPKEYNYLSLIRQIQNKEIIKLDVYGDPDPSNTGHVKVTFATPASTLEANKNNQDTLLQNKFLPAPAVSNYTMETVTILDMNSFMSMITQSILDGNINIASLNLIKTKPNWLIAALPILLPIMLGIILISFITQQFSGGGGSGGRGGAMSFGKSKAKLNLDSKNKLKFKDVAGLEEEKIELEEIVDFLKEPKKYLDLGAKIPKGILLMGPPGTGKTYLAKAVAGEAEVPFFSISGSDFVEMFVGVGASRVRDLFEQAKKNLPCIIFIDEIDAVGRKRGSGHGGGHDEREQTLNQLLIEMDGFSENEGVIIIAATNRKDVLDPALLRPGRFDRQIEVALPDIKGREDILHIHAKGKILDDEVDLRVVAQSTSGFTPADLANLLNEAALLTARSDKPKIIMETIRRAFIKINVGTEKHSHVISDKERRITAYHEAGHAILQELLEELDSTYIVSIIPTGNAGGYSMHLPSEDKSYMSKKFMEETMIVLLGGRIAESLILDDITTGASNDIERATNIARGMVTRYGMSSLGTIQFGEYNPNYGEYIKNYGEELSSKIDDEIKSFIDIAYKKGSELLTLHIEILHRIATNLLENEKITGEEIRKMFPEGVLKNDIKEGFMSSNEPKEISVDSIDITIDDTHDIPVEKTDTDTIKENKKTPL